MASTWLSLWGHPLLEPNHQAVREPKLAHVMRWYGKELKSDSQHQPPDV